MSGKILQSVNRGGKNFKILEICADQGATPVGEIAKTIGVHPNDLRQFLLDLEASGFVKTKYVAITPEGLNALKQAEAR